MLKKTFRLEVVTIKKQIFSGLVSSIRVTGSEGEFVVFYNHISFLTTIKPGMIQIWEEDSKVQYIYLSGGIISVQPGTVVTLSDTAIRGMNLNAEKVKELMYQAEEKYRNTSYFDSNYFHVSTEFAKEKAKLRVINLTKMNRTSSE